MTCACGCRDTIIEEKEAMTDKTELEEEIKYWNDSGKYEVSNRVSYAVETILASHAALTERVAKYQEALTEVIWAIPKNGGDMYALDIAKRALKDTQ